MFISPQPQFFHLKFLYNLSYPANLQVLGETILSSLVEKFMFMERKYSFATAFI